MRVDACTPTRFLTCWGTVLLSVGLTVLFILSVASCAGGLAARSTASPGVGRERDAQSGVGEDEMIAGQPLTISFPRLGMWWPDPWEQPITDIARYDWVILGD